MSNLTIMYVHTTIRFVYVTGISLWDCVVSNILSRSSSNRHIDLLTFYHPLALPANAVYVLLLSLVMISLLDLYRYIELYKIFYVYLWCTVILYYVRHRFDFASINKRCLYSFFKTPVQIILLVGQGHLAWLRDCLWKVRLYIHKSVGVHDKQHVTCKCLYI